MDTFYMFTILCYITFISIVLTHAPPPPPHTHTHTPRARARARTRAKVSPHKVNLPLNTQTFFQSYISAQMMVQTTDRDSKTLRGKLEGDISKYLMLYIDFCVNVATRDTTGVSCISTASTLVKTLYRKEKQVIRELTQPLEYDYYYANGRLK